MFGLILTNFRFQYFLIERFINTDYANNFNAFFQSFFRLYEPFYIWWLPFGMVISGSVLSIAYIYKHSKEAKLPTILRLLLYIPIINVFFY